MKKRYTFLFSVFLFLGAVFTPYVPAAEESSNGQAALTIVTTIFPEYDWVLNVLGENPGQVKVSLLLDNGVDLHSFQPTAEDILELSTCDLFIYVGGESDKWVQDALGEALNEDMIKINLLDALGDQAKEEELAEGMEGEAEEGEETGYDEHVWLSLRNAAFFVQKIADTLASLDPVNADIYQTNAGAYISKLDALDDDYQEAVSDASVKTLLFGDRFPFRYLTDDYGLDYYAAFSGCSAETEASFETIIFLANKVDELSLPAIITIEGSDQRIAETIRDTSGSKNQQIIALDSMQSSISQDADQGKNYLSVMKSNLDALKEALGTAAE